MTTEQKITSIRVSMRWRDIEQHEADFLLAELDAARAREAKLLAVLRQCKCIGVRDYATCDQRREPVSRMCPRCAALAEGKGR